MSDALYTFISTDLPPLLALTFACMVCALLGNFLVLRRESLMGDAISHAVLPGLVIAFLLFNSRGASSMLAGAAVSGLVAVLLIESLRRRAPIEPGAAMGVVFCSMFALGVVLLRVAAAENVDLDADCVLYGQAETIIWFPPRDWPAFLSVETLTAVPRQVVTLSLGFVVALIIVVIFFKELVVTSFDPALSASLGFSPKWVTRALMAMVAAASVISFEAVGSILVIAMLICPAATARMLTDRIKIQVLLSVVLGAAIGIAGYLIGALLPLWIGFDRSVIVSGTASVVAGLAFLLAALGAPRYGVLAQRRRKRHVAAEVALEDVLGMLFRAGEMGRDRMSKPELMRGLGSASDVSHGLTLATRRGLVREDGTGLQLTDSGRAAAASVIRSHRLWELFLVRELGLRPDHVHATAERLEHLREADRRLEPPLQSDRDPHDRAIPRP